MPPALKAELLSEDPTGTNFIALLLGTLFSSIEYFSDVRRCKYWWCFTLDCRRLMSTGAGASSSLSCCSFLLPQHQGMLASAVLEAVKQGV